MIAWLISSAAKACLSPRSATRFQPGRIGRLLWGPSLIANSLCQLYSKKYLTMSTNKIRGRYTPHWRGFSAKMKVKIGGSPGFQRKKSARESSIEPRLLLVQKRGSIVPAVLFARLDDAVRCHSLNGDSIGCTA